MSLSRTDLIPVLAIVAGGVIGASLSLNFLVLSPRGDVPVLALAQVVEPVPTVPLLGPVSPPPLEAVVPVPSMVPVPALPSFPPLGMPIRR